MLWDDRQKRCWKDHFICSKNMNRQILVLIFCAGIFLLPAQPYKSGEELLKAMHKKLYKAPCNCYTFSQKNTHFRSDTVSGSSEWHEAVQFPDRFRIHFGAIKDSNYVLFRNDSLYGYKKGKLTRSRADTNNLLLLLGGMYYRDFEDVTRRLKHAGFNLSLLSGQAWKDKKALVIGVASANEREQQIWVDPKTFNVLRIIENRNETDIMDIRFNTHQKFCKGYIENSVTFLRNGKMEQEEKYFDIKKECGF
jgi:hypothetical protein